MDFGNVGVRRSKGAPAGSDFSEYTLDGRMLELAPLALSFALMF